MRLRRSITLWPLTMEPEETKDRTNTIPRGAIAVVAVGLVCTLAVLALDFMGGSSTADIPWQTSEEIKVPPPAKIGKDGEFAMERTTLSATGQNGGGEGESVFRISGILRLDTNGKDLPTQALCEFEVLDDESSIARTPKGRAAFPRPTNDFDLQKQGVPEELTVKFNAVGNDYSILPIRDAINKYTNSDVRTTANWTPFEERVQSWIWELPEGTGSSASLLGYAVVFKTAVKPEASIRCEATIDGKSVVQEAMAVQQEWPLEEPSAETTEETAEDTTNVE